MGKAEERKAWPLRIFCPSQSLSLFHPLNINHGRLVGDHEFTLRQTLKNIKLLSMKKAKQKEASTSDRDQFNIAPLPIFHFSLYFLL